MPNDESAAAPLHDPLEVYRALVAASPDAVTMTDLEGKITFVSTQTLALHGYGQESEVLGKSAFELIAPEDRAAALENLKLTLERGQARGLEYILLRKDGRRFPAELNTALVRDARGDPRAFVAFTRDITERKKAETVLHQSEERFRALLESVTDYTYTVEVENGKPVRTRHGPNCVAVTGYEPGEYDADALLWHRMVHDDDKQAVSDHATAILGGRVTPIEHRIVHKDGSVRWVRNTPAARFDKLGRLTSYDGTVTDITESVRSKEELRESEERYRQLVELSPDAVAVHCRGKLVYVNPTCVNLFGAKSVEEVIGREVLDFVHPDYRDTVRQRIGMMLAEGARAPLLEEKFVKLDGSVLDVEVAAGPFPYQGRPAVLVAFRDITERKRTEHALRITEARNKALLEAIPDMMFVVDLGGRILDFKAEKREQLAVPAEKVIGTNIADIGLTPEYLELARGSISEACASGAGQRFEYGLETPLGPGIFEARVSALDRESALVIVRDVTLARMAEAALRESEERHRLLLNSIRLPVLALSADMSIYYCNQAYADLTGRRIGEMEDEKLLELFPSFAGTKSYQAYLKCLETGHSTEAEGEHRGRHLHAWVYRTQKGILAIAEDITERKQAEEVLRRDRETFQRMVEERTSELLKAREELQRAERLSELGRLSVTVAHELRNPLGVMRIAAFNMGRKGPDPGLRRHLRNIEQKIAESERIVNNLLGFARIQAPKLEHTDLARLIKECATETRKRWPRVRVKKSLAPIAGMAVPADRMQIKEALQNVLENAAQAAPARGGVVEVAAEAQGRGVEIRIANNGPAIRPEDLPNIFKPFFTTRARGVGLGLTIAKELVELHRGIIAASSRGEEGTEFVIWIPSELGGKD